MEFVGPPFIFNFRQLGSNCGIAGQHAAIELDGRIFWMGAKEKVQSSTNAQKFDSWTQK